MDPPAPDGENGWYISPITVTLVAHDNDTEPVNVTTYYRINGGDIIEYLQPFELAIERPDNMIEFWSIDIAMNEELPHNLVEDIKIDFTAPFITLYEPPDVIFPGEVHINGTVVEYTSGSGIIQVRITMNDELIYNDTYSEEHNVWFDEVFTAEYGESFDIRIEAWDSAGLKRTSRKQVICTDLGMYEPGYIYLLDNPKIGPFPILEGIGLAIAVKYDYLYMILPEVHENATTVEFVASHVNIQREITCTDTNLTNGVSCEMELLLPIGFYYINAYAYNASQVLLEEYVIVPQMFVLIL
jgi:hypothetical protein